MSSVPLTWNDQIVGVLNVQTIRRRKFTGRDVSFLETLAALLAGIVERCPKAAVEVGMCGTCMDARGLTDEEVVAGTRRSSMAEMAEWTAWADKVLTW